MERRRKPGPRTRASRIDVPDGEEHTFDVSSLPHIENFINYGQIVLGIMEPSQTSATVYPETPGAMFAWNPVFRVNHSFRHGTLIVADQSRARV
jgi:hypothetical protein